MIIQIKVTPRAKRTKIDSTTRPWRIWVTAPPVENAANQAVIQLVADYLGLPKSAVTIRHGHTDRLKLLEVPDGVELTQLTLL